MEVTQVRTIIPLATLYEYDPSIFDGIYIKGVDTAEFIDYFLLSYGDMTPIYTIPTLLQRNITLISQSLKWSIDKLYHLTEIEYNPIYNRELHEEMTTSRDNMYQKGTTTTESSFQKGTISTTGTYKKGTVNSDSTFQKGTISLSNTENVVDSHKVAAFNASDLQIATGDNKEDTRTGTESHGVDTTNTTESFDTDNSNSSETHGVDTTTETLKNDVDTTNETTARSYYRYGKIGNSYTQSLLIAERNVAMLNYIDDVCRLYAERLLIGIW